MALIQLPKATVKLIGSSQVITSVSSVVKELLENSIDAGANNIEIKLEKHGLEKIEVKDDGCGVGKDNVTVMCLPNYTSKISDFSDLDKLKSYGFRGEALSSLCNVSQVCITTKTADDDIASSYTYDKNGQIVSSKISHITKGTIIVVSDLFKNLPVRKQFLSNSKRAADELKKVERIVKSLAMIHPRLRVSLVHNKFLIWQKTSVANLRQSVMQVISLNIVKQLHHIVQNTSAIRVEMLVPNRECDVASLSFSNFTDAYFLFINNRPVRNKEVEKAVYNKLFEYFGVYVPVNKYPVCVTSLVVSSDGLDVNLEPDKTRVYFKNQEDVLEIVTQCLLLYYGEGVKEAGDGKSALKLAKKRKLEGENSEDNSKKAVVVETLVAFDGSSTSEEFSSQSTKCSELSEDDNVQGKHLLQRVVNEKEDVHNNQEADEMFEKFCLNKNSEPKVASENLHLVNLDVNKGPIHEDPIVNIFSSNKDEYKNEIEHIQEVPKNNIFSNNLGDETSSKYEPQIPSEYIFPNCSESVLNIENTKEISRKDIFSNSSFEESKSNSNFNSNTENRINKTLQSTHSSRLLNQQSATLKNYFHNLNNSNDGNEENKKSEHSCYANSSSVRMKNVVHIEETNENKIVDEHLLSDKTNCMKSGANEMPSSSLTGISSPTLSQWSRGDILISSSPTAAPIDTKKNEKCAVVSSPLSQYNRSVSSQMGCKEMSAFTKFARNMRKQILEENPKMSFTRVAQQLQVQWRQLNEDERKTFEETPFVKKITCSNDQKKQQTLATFIDKRSPDIELDISFEKLKEMSCKNSTKEARVQLVGQLEASPLWVYQRPGCVPEVCSMLRLQEAVKFRDYLANFALPTRLLDQPIQFRSKDIGTSDWSLLLTLDRSPNGIITDPRLISNGLMIEILEGEEEGRITYVPQHISYFGLEELQEVLGLLRKHGMYAELVQCRPLKVISFLRSEVMRECSKREPPNCKEGVFELLENWLRNVLSESPNCIHHLPVSQPLIS